MVDIPLLGTEYGTNKAILIGSLNEAESLGDVHIAIRDKLIDVQTELKQWRNENYKKQMVGGCKESKTFDDDFKKVHFLTSAVPHLFESIEYCAGDSRDQVSACSKHRKYRKMWSEDLTVHVAFLCLI